MDNKHAASWLAYAGLLPFLAAPVVLWSGFSVALDVDTALRVYSALIVSFLAGIHWHVGMSRSGSEGWLLWESNVVVLVAWALVFIDSSALVCLLFAGLYVAVLLFDRALSKKEILPDWFYRLRVRVSTVVIVALLITAAVFATTKG